MFGSRPPGQCRCGLFTNTWTSVLWSISARLDPAEAAITWEWPICGDNGFIRG
jgi:hypothetical protein